MECFIKVFPKNHDSIIFVSLLLDSKRKDMVVTITKGGRRRIKLKKASKLALLFSVGSFSHYRVVTKGGQRKKS
jgi:hypothetical protein